MPANFFKDYLNGLSNIFSMINLKDFESFVKELKQAHEKESYIFICGNGGCASTASHFVCDINKGVSYGKDKKFKVISLNDNVASMLAYANDTSYDDIFVEQLKNLMNKGDLVIGMSASGNSENVLEAIRYGNENGGRTFGVCGYDGGKLKQLAQKSLLIESNDMQKVEDLHVIVFHCAMQYLNATM